MRLVTYRKGSANPRVGALTADAVLDLRALTVDLARERGLARPAPGGRFGTMLELIAGGDDARSRAREALEHGLAVWKREGVDGLAAKKLGAPAAISPAISSTGSSSERIPASPIRWYWSMVNR